MRHPWPLVGRSGLLCASALLPLLFMAATAFRTQADWANSKIGLPTTFSFGAFARAWTDANIGTYFRNSVIVTVSTVLLTVRLRDPRGLRASRRCAGGCSGAVYLFVLAWIAIPPLLLMVPIYVEMVQLGLLDTYGAVIFLYTALNLPFNVYLMTAFFRSVPDELIEAARVDGAGLHRIFLPDHGPAREARRRDARDLQRPLGLERVPVRAADAPVAIRVKTLTVGVLQLQGRFTTDYPALMAGLLITSLPVVGAYLIFQRHLVRGIVAGAVK